MPVPNLTFAAWAVTGGFAQIGATFLLVHLFAFRNFAVCTAYSRTEPAQAALVALVILGETITFGTVVAIVLSVIGVMLISEARTASTPPSPVQSMSIQTGLICPLSAIPSGILAISDERRCGERMI